MPHAVLVIQSRPSDPARETEYLDWYDNVHIPEICQVPGFVSGRHFRISDAQVGGAAPDPTKYPFLTIYEIESEDLKGVFAEMLKRGAAGEFHRSDALQTDPPPITTCYELRGQ